MCVEVVRLCDFPHFSLAPGVAIFQNSDLGDFECSQTLAPLGYSLPSVGDTSRSSTAMLPNWNLGSGNFSQVLESLRPSMLNNILTILRRDLSIKQGL